MGWLDTVTKVVVVLAGVSVFGGEAISTARALAVRARRGTEGAITQSSATASEASVTLTNLNAFPVYACLQGKVTNRAGNSAETLAVCTGDMAPHSTVHLVAPFKVGAVLDLCNKSGPLGKTLDWSDCTFDMVDRTNLAQ